MVFTIVLGVSIFNGVQVTELHLFLGLVCDTFPGMVFLEHPHVCTVPDHSDKFPSGTFTIEDKPFVTRCFMGNAVHRST